MAMLKGNIMKIRIGFVSNSSTSSFCIYGCSMDENKAIDLLKSTGSLTEEQNTGEIYEILEEIAEKHKLKFHMPGDYADCAYFGFDFETIPNDINVGEWKAEKEAFLKTLFGENIDCCVFSEVWENR